MEKRKDKEKNLYKDVKLPIPANDILNHVAGFVLASDNYTDTKKQEIRENWQTYRKASLPRDQRLKNNMIYNAIQTYMDFDSVDDNKIDFEPTGDNILLKDKAIRITKTAEEDTIIGEYDKYLEKAEFEKLFTGLGVTMFCGWNKDKNYPIMTHVPTLSLLVDPKGGNNPQNHRFVGGRMRYDVNDLLNKKSGFIVDTVKELVEKYQSIEDSDTQETKTWLEALFKLQTDTGADMNKSERDSTLYDGMELKDYAKKVKADVQMGIVHTYDIFTRFTGEDGKARKYKVVVDQGCNYILKIEELKGTTKAEKSNPMLVPYPIYFDHFYTVNDIDLYGQSLPNLLEDKQGNLSILLNSTKDLLLKNQMPTLMVKKGRLKPNQLIYDRDKIIEVESREGESIAEAATNLPMHNINLNEVLALMDKIEQQAERITGVSDATAGIGVQRGADTATQSKIIESNANTRIVKRIQRKLNAKRGIYYLWLKQVQMYYNSTGDKRRFVTIENGGATSTFPLNKEDFVSDMPLINPKSSYLEKLEGQKANVAITPMLSTIAETGDIAAYNFGRRTVLKNSGIPEDEINKLISKSKEEIIIENQNILLSNNYKVELDDRVPLELRIKYQMGIDTDEGRLFEIKIMDEINNSLTQQSEVLPLPQMDDTSDIMNAQANSEKAANNSETGNIV